MRPSRKVSVRYYYIKVYNKNVVQIWERKGVLAKGQSMTIPKRGGMWVTLKGSNYFFHNLS